MQQNEKAGDRTRLNKGGPGRAVKRGQVKQKQVGDETANPLPDDPYNSSQPLGDTNEANPQGESPVD